MSGACQLRLLRIKRGMICDRPRAVIFDLDGTLVDSLPGIARALNAALDEFSLRTWPEKTVATFIGNGSWQLARLAIPTDALDSLADKVESAFQRHYAEMWMDGTTPYSGVIELLETLDATDFPMAILSNKPHDFTRKIVSYLFPQIAFSDVRGQQKNSPKKPDPTVALDIAKMWKLPPEKIAYVGDSDVDLATALNAQMQPVIVGWGYNTPEAKLRDLGLCALREVKDFEEIF